MPTFHGESWTNRRVPAPSITGPTMPVLASTANARMAISRRLMVTFAHVMVGIKAIHIYWMAACVTEVIQYASKTTQQFWT